MYNMDTWFCCCAEQSVSLNETIKTKLNLCSDIGIQRLIAGE